jgi:hypothetical protein
MQGWWTKNILQEKNIRDDTTRFFSCGCEEFPAIYYDWESKGKYIQLPEILKDNVLQLPDEYIIVEKEGKKRKFTSDNYHNSETSSSWFNNCLAFNMTAKLYLVSDKQNGTMERCSHKNLVEDCKTETNEKRSFGFLFPK